MTPRSVPLPVSARRVAFRAADGADDLLLHEAAGEAAAVIGLLVVSRLARAAEGDEIDWPTLTVTDFEVALLALRASVFGSLVECKMTCPHEQCGARLEVPFRIEDYLGGVTPTRPRGVLDEERRGWFRIDGAAFRLPTVGDQVAVLGSANAGAKLTELCIEPAGRRGALRGRIERAMAAMAPEVSRPMTGSCPECSAAVSGFFHVPSFVVSELRRATVAVHDEIHLIAGAYHWSEAVIVAMPRARRQQYAERIHRQRLEAM